MADQVTTPGDLPCGYTIHPLALDNLHDVARVNAEAFGTGADAMNMARLRARVNVDLSRGLWYRGVLVGAMVVSDRRVRAPSGSWVDAAGVSWLAVTPAHQHRGFFDRLADTCRSAIEEAGRASLIVAYAARQDSYHSRGFAVAARSVQASFRGRMRLPTTAAVATAAPLTPEHLTLLADLHGRWTGPSGQFEITHEDVAEWLDPKFRASGDDPPAVVWTTNAEGAVSGCAVYQRRHTSDPAGRLWVMDLVALDVDARAGLWSHLTSAGSGNAIVTPPLAVDSPETHWIRDYRRDRVLFNAGLQIRIVDAPAALASRGYYENLAPTTFAIRQAERPANVQRLTMGVDGDAQVEANQGRSGPCDVECTSREVAATYLGGVTWSALEAAGLVRINRGGLAEELDRAFSPPRHHPHAHWDF